MATATYYVNRDSRIARRTSDSWDAGSGTSDFLPFGLYGGYQFRTLLRFNINTSGWTAISSAILHMRTSTQSYVAFGSSPTARIQRLTADFSEGSSLSLSSSNAVIYPGPAASSTNAVTLNMGTAESTWKTADITAMMQDVLGGTFLGVRLLAWNGTAESTSSTDVGEIYAREQGSSDAYIVVTYSTNTVPNAPVLTLVDGVAYTPGMLVASTTPVLTWQYSDGDADTSNFTQNQLATDTGYSAGLQDSGSTARAVANNATWTWTPAALTRGTTYYVRAKASDAVSGYGAYSGNYTFKIASNPVPTLTEPSATGRLGKLSFTAGGGWASPRLNTAWTFSCPDGGSQSSYGLRVVNDNAGSPNEASPLYDSGTVAGTTTSLVVPATLTEAAYYHVRVTVTCSHGLSVTTAYFRIRVRWGVVTHRKDLTAAPTTWSIQTLNTTTTPGSNDVIMEYGSDAAANASPSSGWSDSLTSVARYFFYRSWLLSWGASPATSPSLDKLVLSYSASLLVPDKWSRNDTTNISVDESTFVYGTQSLKIVRTGSDLIAYQTVALTPNTNYVLSGRIKSTGNSQAQLQIVNAANTAVLLATTPVAATQDWTRMATIVWNSGANTACIIRCNVPAGAAIGSIAWFDAMKFEASSVVTPWTPSFLADAIVMDAGGLQIDGAAGGIFRLRGSTGGTRDRVDLGANGLKFGGDVNLYSDATGVLKTDGKITTTKASAAKDQLTIPDTTAGAGLTIGGDTNLYRSAADTLKTDDSLVVVGGITGIAPIVRVYTTVGANTWTKPAGLSHIVVEVIGGGGGGGGTPATGAAQYSFGTPGGGGAYARKLFTAANLSGASSFTATVGAAGTAGSGVAGGAGGASSFAGTGITTVTANGGVGGAVGAAGADPATSVDSAGGSASGGDINTPGCASGRGRIGGSYFTPALSGFCAGFSGPVITAMTASGTAGNGYGGGGGAATASVSVAARSGGAGTTGLVIVTEFYGP